MPIKYCPNCMKVMEGSICGHCGFDIGKSKQSEHALEWNTLLLQRYVTGKVLGQSAIGFTYLGYDVLRRKKVAIRELYPQDMTNRGRAGRVTWAEAFSAEEQEALCEGVVRNVRKVLQTQKVPAGLVAFLDAFLENGTAYYIMEYLEGRTLATYIEEEGVLPLDTCRAMLDPVCDAVEWLHSLGIIHMDVSAEHMIVSDTGRVQLLDFCPAQDCLDKLKWKGSFSRSGYSPPEQYDGSDVGVKTDVYSFCATMYVCLTGDTPPLHKEISWDAVPRSVQPILEKGLSLQLERRIASISELLSRLDGDYTEIAELDALGGAVYDTTTVLFQDELERRRLKSKAMVKWALVGVLIAVLALIAGLSLARALQGDKPAVPQAEEPSNSVTESSATGSASQEESGDISGAAVNTSRTEGGAISLNYNAYELEKGATVALEVKETEGREITWSSSGEKTASVDKNGFVTANAVGTASITARTEDGQTAACNITVPGIVELKLDTESLLLEVGQTHEFHVSITKFGTPDDTVTVSSSDLSVASMSGMELTAVQEGRTTLTFTAGSVSTSCTVIVKQPRR